MKGFEPFEDQKFSDPKEKLKQNPFLKLTSFQDLYLLEEKLQAAQKYTHEITDE